jgi:DnaJ homolog subfamily C member 7
MPDIKESRQRRTLPANPATRDRDKVKPDKPDNKIPRRSSNKPQRLPQHQDTLDPRLSSKIPTPRATTLTPPSSSPSPANPSTKANQARRSPLTRESLRALDSENKRIKHSLCSPEAHMRKSKKAEKKKPKKDKDSHPLNLPPDELRNLSAAMAEAENGSPMDIDQPEQPSSPKKTSPPKTPFQSAPGAFPDSATNGETNGINGRDDEKSPTPPPHKEPPLPPSPPPVDAEACKAAGNKFFKAKDFARAIVEYTKGTHLSYTRNECR